MQIDGYFNLRDESVLKLGVGSSLIEVLVDTGFSGSLIVPSEIANGLDLQFEGPEEFQTANGEMVLADAGSVEVNWLGDMIRVAIAAHKDFKEALLGGHMLRNCRLIIDYGRRTVTIVKN